MDEYREANRRNWDDRAGVHPDTDFYDVEAVLDGGSSLFPLEREELGPLVDEGTELLHLQCHFGLDSLSWAREGATVVGVDFSPEAIETARDLATEAGLADRTSFVEADVLELDLDRRFDVVVATWGVLAWLPDLSAWAETIARHLRDGGSVYLADGHPVASMFATIERGERRGTDDVDERETARATIDFPYFRDEPVRFDYDGSYADEDVSLDATVNYQWAHSLGEVVTALVGAGFRVEFLREHPWATFRRYPDMIEDDEGRYRLPEDVPFEVPLSFSVLATLVE